MTKPSLSVLICSLYSRSDQLAHLLSILEFQASEFRSEVEILTCIDNGEDTIGSKRNRLLAQAKGQYVVFIDDDDLPGPCYTALILRATRMKPDAVGITAIMISNDQISETCIHSSRYKHWFYRIDPLLCPVRKDIATQAGFPNSSHGEDLAYSTKLRNFIKSEVFIDTPIYYYQFTSKIADPRLTIKRRLFLFLVGLANLPGKIRLSRQGIKITSIA